MENLIIQFDNRAAAIVSGKGSQKAEISLIDALSGKLGIVKGISMQIEIEQKEKPSVPFVSPEAGTPLVDKPTPADQQPATTAKPGEMVVHRIAKDSKVWKLMNALMRKRGVTFEQLKEILGMTDGGASSYLYYYPGTFGCKLTTEKVDGRGTVYRLEIPQGVRIVEKAPEKQSATTAPTT
jgi:hypothetical protein